MCNPIRRCALNKRRETGQRCSRTRHIIHDNLTAIQTHHSAALWLRVRVAGVIAHRLLALPRLSQRVVNVRIVIDERVRIGTNALVFAFRILNENAKVPKMSLLVFCGKRSFRGFLSALTCESLELTSDGFSVTLLSSGFSS